MGIPTDEESKQHFFHWKLSTGGEKLTTVH